MNKNIKAIAYARVSSKEQAEKATSIPAQLEAIRNFCNQKGWTLVKEFIDAGKSAKTDDRPEFQRMIALAKKANRGFDAIVVHKFDRFSRNREDHIIYKSLLKNIGIHVYSVTEQTDPETPHGFLIEGILEVISEFYNMNLSAEVKKGMRTNAKRGYHNGGIAPYGYRLTKVSQDSGGLKTILVPGPDEEVSIVKRIFHMYVYEGCGYKKIASTLNEENIPSAKGNKWSYSSIHAILHNEAYIGNRVWNQYDYSKGKKKKPESEWIRCENSHTALVSKEVFDLVKEKSKSRIKNSAVFEATNSPFILRGLLKCPYCGTNMVGGQSGGRGKTKNVRRYYLCGLYHRKGKTACKFKSFNKKKIESSIINVLLKEFTLLNIDRVLDEEIAKYISEKNKEKQFRLNSISQEIELTKMRIDILSNDLEVTEDKNKIKQYIEDLKQNLTSLKKENISLNQSLENYNIDSITIEILKDKINNFINKILSSTPDIQNSLLKEFVEDIKINLVSNMITIHIKLAFPNNPSEVIFDKNIYVSL